MTGKIIIQREKQFLNKMRGVKVFIDGEEKTTIANGGAGEYVVDAGTHKIICKISWFQSHEMEVAVKERETKFLKTSMGMKYFGVAYAILLLAILSDIIPRAAGFPKPEWWPMMKLAIIIPLLLYFLYYFTVGRKNYLLLENDKANIFS